MTVARFNRIRGVLLELSSSLDNASVGLMRFDRGFCAAEGDELLPAHTAAELRQLAVLCRQFLRAVPVAEPSSSGPE